MRLDKSKFMHHVYCCIIVLVLSCSFFTILHDQFYGQFFIFFFYLKLTKKSNSTNPTPLIQYQNHRCVTLIKILYPVVHCNQMSATLHLPAVSERARGMLSVRELSHPGVREAWGDEGVLEVYCVRGAVWREAGREGGRGRDEHGGEGGAGRGRARRGENFGQAEGGLCVCMTGIFRPASHDFFFFLLRFRNQWRSVRPFILWPRDFIPALQCQLMQRRVV